MPALCLRRCAVAEARGAARGNCRDATTGGGRRRKFTRQWLWQHTSERGGLQAHTHAHRHTDTRTHTHAHTHAHRHTDTDTRTHTHTDRHTHTHRFSPRRVSFGQEVIKSLPILQISFSAVHPKDSKLIMWITNDPRLELMYCHAFQVKKTKVRRSPNGNHWRSCPAAPIAAAVVVVVPPSPPPHLNLPTWCFSKGEVVLKTMAQAFTSAKQQLQASQGDEDALRELGVSNSRKTQSNGACAVPLLMVQRVGSERQRQRQTETERQTEREKAGV